jgi:signal transduction histidine kinase
MVSARRKSAGKVLHRPAARAAGRSGSRKRLAAARKPVPQSAFAFRTEDEKVRFLLRASEILSSSLEYEETLASVAHLVVPRLAEWCTVHVLHPDGEIEQLAITHADPAMIKYARTLNRKYPPNYDGPQGMRAGMRERKSLLVPEITDEMLAKSARDAEHLRISRSLKISSVMGVPLVARGQALGYITLIATDDRHYTAEDLAFAEELAVRAALAVDNARLYREARRATREVKSLNADLERKVRERTQELRLSQERDRSNLHRLKSMLASLPQAALMMDESHNIIELNEGYCATFHIGMSAAEAMRLPPADLNERFSRLLAHPEDHMQEVQKTLKLRKPLLGFDIHLNDGRVVQRDFLPIFDGGRFLGQLFLYRDVTQERRIDATKSEFMSLASHQLRTPLTAIRWIFGRLAKNLAGKVGPLEEHLLEDGRSAAARMSETISTMLQISRIQSGQMQVRSEEVALPEFLRDLVRSSTEAITARGQKVKVSCTGKPVIRTDRQLLQEVMANLLSNALKYTPEKGSILLKAEQKGTKIHIHVEDTGYGIPRHQQAKVFHKFFRGDNVVSKDPDGTGLGLHMVSLITGLLGGTIDFESAEGRGTTFRLRLPVR